jgi:hypothetical protein
MDILTTSIVRSCGGRFAAAGIALAAILLAAPQIAAGNGTDVASDVAAARASHGRAASASSTSKADGCASRSTSMQPNAQGCTSAPYCPGSPKPYGTVMFNSVDAWVRHD